MLNQKNISVLMPYHRLQAMYNGWEILLAASLRARSSRESHDLANAGKKQLEAIRGLRMEMYN